MNLVCDQESLDVILVAVVEVFDDILNEDRDVIDEQDSCVGVGYPNFVSFAERGHARANIL